LITSRQLTKHGLFPSYIQLENCKFVSLVFETEKHGAKNIKCPGQMQKRTVSKGGKRSKAQNSEG
jgi:hypothetical protein